MRDLQFFEIQTVNGGNSGVSFTAGMLLGAISDDYLWVIGLSATLGLACSAPFLFQGGFFNALGTNAASVLIGAIAGQYLVSVISEQK